MTRTSHEPEFSGALAALTELGRDGVKRPARAEIDHGLNVLFSRIATGRVRRRGLIRWSVIGVATIMSTLVVLHFTSLARKAASVSARALTYQVEGGSVLDGGYLRESGHSGIKLLFNEGSTFALMPGTRGRLRAVNNEGARVAIDSGTASFRITPSSDRRWWVESGPFLVTVKGTVFVVSWEPSSERFDLRLRQGSVVVSGPVSGGDLTLRAGQRLVVSLPKAEALITEDRPEETVVDSVGTPAPSTLTQVVPQPSNAQPKAAGPPPSTAQLQTTSANVRSERHWAQELASGHWDRILEDVERTGVEAALNGASSEDLFALADAARYRRRPDLARDALLAERRRFPNSPRALDALFLLGRVEESRGSGVARAIAWYDEYLAQAPTGGYAAEALGRKMIVAKQVGGVAKARAIAEEYLRRFPQGSYAGTARALLRVP